MECTCKKKFVSWLKRNLNFPIYTEDKQLK